MTHKCGQLLLLVGEVLYMQTVQKGKHRPLGALDPAVCQLCLYLTFHM